MILALLIADTPHDVVNASGRTLVDLVRPRVLCWRVRLQGLGLKRLGLDGLGLERLSLDGLSLDWLGLVYGLNLGLHQYGLGNMLGLDLVEWYWIGLGLVCESRTRVSIVARVATVVASSCISRCECIRLGWWCSVR